MHDELQDSRTGKLTPTLSDLLRTASVVDQQQRRYDHPPARIEELALVTQQRGGPPSHLKTEQLSRCPQAFHNEQGRKEPQNPRPSVRARGVLEESLGRSSIPPGGKQEIDRGTGRVDGPVQVGPLAFHP
jgi:hypothetical protein